MKPLSLFLAVVFLVGCQLPQDGQDTNPSNDVPATQDLVSADLSLEPDSAEDTTPTVEQDVVVVTDTSSPWDAMIGVIDIENRTQQSFRLILPQRRIRVWLTTTAPTLRHPMLWGPMRPPSMRT